VRALHDAGVEHADLNLKNLLVRPGPPVEAFVIDLDKSRRGGPLSRAAAVRNLERLLRSAEKLGLLGSALSRADLARFVRAYAERDWRGLFLAARRRWRALAPFHRVGWAIGARAAAKGRAAGAQSTCAETNPSSPAPPPTSPATPCSP
jgi:aminoglycoside phosphotransferase (APT) family kinase protein